MDPCYNTSGLNSQKQHHKPNIINNNPIYDIKCRYYNTNNGCYYGKYCYFKHIIKTPSQTPYQKLIQYQITTNNILQNLLSSLTLIINKLSTEPDSDVFATTKPEPELEPELKCDSPTPIPTIESPVKSNFKSKNMKVNSKLILKAMARTPSPTPTSKADPSPTTRYFEATQQQPHIITDIEAKAQFINWAINYIITDKIENEILSDIVAHVLYGYAIGSDIVTGNKLVSSIESVLCSMYDIKYRKILNSNNNQDL